MLNVWMRVAHISGFVFWIAGIIAVWGILSLVRGADASSRHGLISAGRSMALLMDIGGTVAILAGTHLAMVSGAFARPWMHVKLTFVVFGVLAAHIVLRMRLRKLRGGTVADVPRALAIIVLLSAVVITVLAKHPTLLR